MRRSGRRGVPRRDGSRFPINPVKAILGSLYFADFAANDPAMVLNAGNVSSWPNRGSDKAPAIQGTAANQPAFSLTSFNGGPGVTGDGVNDLLVATWNNPIAIGKRPHVWLVMQLIATTNGRVQMEMTQTVVLDRSMQLYNAVANFAAYSDEIPDNFNGSAIDTSRHMIEYGMTASATGRFRVDANAFNGTGTNALTKAAEAMAIFDIKPGGSPANMALARLIMASDEPSAQQKADVRTYLRGNNFPGYTGSNYGIP